MNSEEQAEFRVNNQVNVKYTIKKLFDACVDFHTIFDPTTRSKLLIKLEQLEQIIDINYLYGIIPKYSNSS